MLDVRITLRSPAGDFQKAGDSPPSQLHFKGFSGDGFLQHRACQVQQLVLRRVRDAGMVWAKPDIDVGQPNGLANDGAPRVECNDQLTVRVPGDSIRYNRSEASLGWELDTVLKNSSERVIRIKLALGGEERDADAATVRSPPTVASPADGMKLTIGGGDTVEDLCVAVTGGECHEESQ